MITISILTLICFLAALTAAWKITKDLKNVKHAILIHGITDPDILYRMGVDSDTRNKADKKRKKESP